VTLTSDASGVTIDPTTITTDGGTATFTMPATAVTVNATFSTQVPDKVPEASEGAITGSSYDNLELEWSSFLEDGGGYLAAIYLNSGGANAAENYDYIETDLFDDTNDQDIDAGTYSYSEVANDDSDYGTDGTFTNFTVLADYNGQDLGNGAAADYVASTVTESELADAGVDTDSPDLITDGTITVSKDGAIYTIEWEMTTEGGETLAGSYEGEVDHVFEEGSEEYRVR
jgi:hypothetical protein